MPGFEYTVEQTVISTCEVTVEAASEEVANAEMDLRIAKYNTGKDGMMIPDMEIDSETWDLR